MHHRSILSAVSIFSSLGICLTPAWAENKQIDFTPDGQSNQNAQTKQFDLTLNVDNVQTFADLRQQAELLARSFIEQGFAESSSIIEISVKIIGDRHGQQVPLLFSRVSRPDWQKQPEIQPWTKYFGSSAVLLGFLKPQSQQASPPRFSPATQMTSPPPSPTTQQQTSPFSGTSIPSGASPEESDPGYR